MPQQATENEKWISQFCREFSVATGWPVEFTPVDPAEADAVRSRFTGDPECCWFREVKAGDEPAGFLHIDLPRDPGLDHSFLAVCDLARLFADLAGRTLAANRSAEPAGLDGADWAEIELHDPQEDNVVAALKSLLSAVPHLTDFQSAAFFLCDPETAAMKLRSAESIRQYQIPRPLRDLGANSPDREAITDGPVVVSAKTSAGADWLPSGCSTGFCIAVKASSNPLGTLWAFDRRGRIPTERECHILQSIAARIGTVLERAVLLRESELQHRQQHDLNLASECQRRDVLHGIPDDAGFEAAAVCNSRFELGGDMCELITLDDSRTLIAIGDASGDSVPAAMVMAAVHGALRALCRFDDREASVDTEEMMRRINHALHEMTPPHQFMSLLFGIFDKRDLTFRYTNARHPAPLHVRGTQVQELESHGMLLGILPDNRYEQSCLHLQPGDLLIAFSDGVSEAMNGRRSMFRPDGIAAAVTPPGERAAGELLEAVWNGLESHIAGTESGDDRTLMVLRVSEQQGARESVKGAPASAG